LEKAREGAQGLSVQPFRPESASWPVKSSSRPLVIFWASGRAEKAEARVSLGVRRLSRAVVPSRPALTRQICLRTFKITDGTGHPGHPHISTIAHRIAAQSLNGPYSVGAVELPSCAPTRLHQRDYRAASGVRRSRRASQHPPSRPHRRVSAAHTSPPHLRCISRRFPPSRGAPDLCNS
jgi:hypothetical protein